VLSSEPVEARAAPTVIVRMVSQNCVSAGTVCTPVYIGPRIVSKGPVTAIFTIFATANQRSHLKVFVDNHPAATTSSVGPGAGSTPATPLSFPHDGKPHTVSWVEVCSCALPAGSHTRYRVTIGYER
jgi:hypothetical protein